MENDNEDNESHINTLLATVKDVTDVEMVVELKKVACLGTLKVKRSAIRHTSGRSKTKMPKRASTKSSAMAAPSQSDDALSMGGLDRDTTNHVWQFILKDQQALASAALVSKEWHTYATRMYTGSLNLSAFASPADYPRLAAFVRVTGLSAYDVDWINNDHLRALPNMMPSLQKIDLSGCQSVSSVGVKAFVKAMGTRLRGFKQDSTLMHSLCKEMKVTEATIKAIAAAPALEELSLTLGSGVKALHQHVPRNSLSTLRKLNVFFAGFTPLTLPLSLPELRELTIKTSEWSSFYWPSPQNYAIESSDFFAMHYPKLEALTIEHRGSWQFNSRPLMEDFVIDLSRRIFPNALIRVVRASKGDMRGKVPCSLRGGLYL
jgi:hypothetical protein